MKTKIIVGGIGTGKSTVTKIFSEHGYYIVSADEISDTILRNNQKTVSKMFDIEELSYEDFKKTLGNLVFTNKQYKEELEKFMLPKIYVRLAYIEHYYKDRKAIFELPTFFENRGLQHFPDKFIILIKADTDIRIERISKRNPHLSKEDIENRINNQIPTEDKEMYCQRVIDNSYDINSLNKIVEKTIKEIELLNF